MAQKIIVANWKMNGAFEEADQWLAKFIDLYSANQEALQKVEMVVCPPSFLVDYFDSQLLDNAFDNIEKIAQDRGKNIEDFEEEELAEIVIKQRPFWLGAQDCHFENSGSFTGDLSAEMIKKIGADYVILGHSERRENHFETDEIVAKKVAAAVAQDILPIICVGESKEVRDQKKHLEFVYKQLLFSIPRGVKFMRLVIAYEPIWSIGTGIVPNSEQIAEMMKMIHKILAEKGQDLVEEFVILYGGSVTAENAKEILAIENVGGLLVGKASLDSNDFVKICLS